MSIPSVAALKPSGYWKDVKNQRNFFDELGVKLNIKEPQDWFRVTRKIIWKEGGYFINNHYNSSVIKGTIDILPLEIFYKFEL
jgi:hypothetical protein